MATQDVLNHHLQAFGAGDAEEIAKDYTEDSVLILADKTLRGVDDIKAAYAGLLEGVFKPGTYDFTMDRTEVVDDVAFVVWHAVCAETNIPLGTDTFLIRDGKIAIQTFAAKFDPK